jgi:hypothetical protein
MTTVLEKNMQIPLKFTSGTILVIKPALGTVTPSTTYHFAFDLNLFNETGDILLYISFSERRITFKHYARRSLGNAWGKVETLDMKGRSECGDTVSIHHYLTGAEFGRYQILLNGITIYHFDKRLPGPATKISYKNATGWAPVCWDVGVSQIHDLLPEDRLALVAGR